MRYLVAILLALGTGLPAHAADLSTIDCVAGKLDAAVKAQIAADVERNFGAVGQKPTYDPSVTRGLSDAAQACAKEKGWSGAAAQAAADYTLAEIGLPVAKKVVAQRGFDPGALETEFQRLPDKTRNKPLTTKAVQGLVIASVTDEAKQTRENASLLNLYFLVLSTIQYAAHDFSIG